MIQVNELRIGNWVHQFRERNERNLFELTNIRRCIQVESIHDGCMNNFDKARININIEDDEIYGIWEEDINPIPITPEILEKCGFEASDEKNYLRHPSIPVMIEFFYNGDFVSPIMLSRGINSSSEDKYQLCFSQQCRHLHQLQNLYFALTGEELTVNL